MTHDHIEFAAPIQEQTAAIRSALAALSPDDMAMVMRQADAVITSIQTARGGTITGMGIGGALELLAKLGVWLNDNPDRAHAARLQIRYDPDDLKPEVNR